MTSRYDNRMTAINNAPRYRSLLKRRGVRFVRQYKTAETHFPTDQEMSQIKEVDYIWAIGDRFFKLAHTYYGDAAMWWIIAWYNQTPTESHVSTGQVIQIPLPLDAVLPIFMRGS